MLADFYYDLGYEIGQMVVPLAVIGCVTLVAVLVLRQFFRSR